MALAGERVAPEPLPDTIAALAAIFSRRSREERLLAAAARLDHGQTARERLLNLLTGPVDWDVFGAKAEAHAVAPLVYRTLARPDLAPLVPPPALARLHASYLANAVANLRWQHELRRLVTRLTDSGIVPILLKGAALLYTLYPDPALRRLSDLDLLVRRRDLRAAEHCLLGLGYESAESEWPVGAWPPNWYEKKFCRRGRATGGTVVEIHWGLADRRAPFRLPMDELIASAEPLSLEGTTARVLDPVHQVLHLCTHMAYNDGFGVGLSRPCDLHEVIEKWGQRLDWERLAAEARRFRVSLCLRYSLAVTAALFGTSLPSHWAERPADPPLRRSLAAAALERVLVNDLDPTPLPSTLAKLASTDRLDLRAALRVLLPRPRHLKHSYRLFQPARVFRAVRYLRTVKGTKP